MKVHPQLLKTLRLMETLRRQGRLKHVRVDFGPAGLEGVSVDGRIEIAEKARKIVDKGDSEK